MGLGRRAESITSDDRPMPSMLGSDCPTSVARRPTRASVKASIRLRACSEHIERASRPCKGLRSCPPTDPPRTWRCPHREAGLSALPLPWLVSLPSATHSGSAIKFSGNSSPRGILIPKFRSRRKTMSRKSIDSAPRSPWSVAPRVISSSSTPKASTKVAWTFSKISSYVGIGSSESRWEAPPTPSRHPAPVAPNRFAADIIVGESGARTSFGWTQREVFAGNGPAGTSSPEPRGRYSTHIMSKKRNRCNISRRVKETGSYRPPEMSVSAGGVM